jgi:hypothetical protein
MAATQKTTGAAAKSQRQAKLSVVRNDEQTREIPVTVVEPTTAQIIEQTAEQVTTDLAVMQAQRRALNEQIKAAKATQPKAEKQPKPEKPSKTLDDVAARQAETVGIGHVLYIAQRAVTRIKLGQDARTAVDQVLAREGEAAKGALELMATGDYPDLRSALMAWSAVNAPLTVVKQHTKVTEGDNDDDEQ